MIELKNITKIYTTEEVATHALQGVDLKINKGDYLSISGPSGCGKSTLLSILGLLDSPSGGEYYIGNKNVSILDMNQRAILRNKEIGFIFQSFNLIDDLSVFNNVALPLRYRGYDKDTIEEKVKKCLGLVEMSHRLDHKPNQLSGGQQQRVAIARALVGEPRLLLVDEPTGNLDSKNAETVMNLLNDLNKQGVTICMVTHEKKFADMASIKLDLLDGKILVKNL